MTNNILLVEDNQDHAEITIDALKANNGSLSITWVKDGESALDFLYCRGDYADRRGFKPCIILLDIRLPGMDGIEVLKNIKNDPNLRQIVVIMLTTSAKETEISRSYINHANSYIVKPVRFDDFHLRIKEMHLYWTRTNHLPNN